MSLRDSHSARRKTHSPQPAATARGFCQNPLLAQRAGWQLESQSQSDVSYSPATSLREVPLRQRALVQNWPTLRSPTSEQARLAPQENSLPPGSPAANQEQRTATTRRSSRPLPPPPTVPEDVPDSAIAQAYWSRIEVMLGMRTPTDRIRIIRGVGEPDVRRVDAPIVELKKSRRSILLVGLEVPSIQTGRPTKSSSRILDNVFA